MDFSLPARRISRVAEGQTVEFRTLERRDDHSRKGRFASTEVSLEHTIFGEDFTTLASMGRPGGREG